MNIIKITALATVVSKHDYKRSVVAEHGGEGAEAGISRAELTPEGDANA